MIKFDKDGWIVSQKVKSRVVHEEDHDRLYDGTSNSILIYTKSEYTSYKQISRNKSKGDLKCVPLNETKYKGKKFEEWNIIDSGALALIGKSVKTGKTIILKILIPKVLKN